MTGARLALVSGALKPGERSALAAYEAAVAQSRRRLDLAQGEHLLASQALSRAVSGKRPMVARGAYEAAREAACLARAAMYDAQALVAELHPDAPDEGARDREVREWLALAVRERATASRWREQWEFAVCAEPEPFDLTTVASPEPNTGCWLCEENETVVAAAVWTAANGSIPAGMTVRPHCGVGACVNPDHLALEEVAA